jgi:thiamine-monophosphate kinase
MIDVSDGLLLDAGRMAEASGLGIRLDTAMIPIRKGATLESALGEGEDYELLFAVREERSRGLIRNWPSKTRLTPVGSFAKIAKGSIISSDGENLLARFAGGFDHFGGWEKHSNGS